MLISLRNLGKPFLTWKTYIYKQKRSKTIAIPKIIFKNYMIKKCKYQVNDNGKLHSENKKT